MNINNRPDNYFSYWILLWFFISLFVDITPPFVFLFIICIAQYTFALTKICPIINSNEKYIIAGNFITIIIKYFAFIYILIYKKNKINYIKEFVITMVLFFIYNIYYYIINKKIYNFSIDSKITEGFMVYLCKNIFNLF